MKSIGFAGILFAILGAFVYCWLEVDSRSAEMMVKRPIEMTQDVAEALSGVSIFVNYDDSGATWITGPSAPANNGPFKSFEDLSKALASNEHKGTAVIAHVYDAKKGGLLGPPPERNRALELKIRIELSRLGYKADGKAAVLEN